MDTLVVELATVSDWVDFEIPDATPHVQLATLWDQDGDRTLLVRFPAGFRREVEGSYEVGEEFTLLTGALHMSGAFYVAPHWVFAPPGYRRSRTHVHEDTLAVTHFDGPARWHVGQSDPAVILHDSPVFGVDRELRPNATRLVAEITDQPVQADVEFLSPRAMTWAWVPAGNVPPPLPGPIVERRIG